MYANLCIRNYMYSEYEIKIYIIGLTWITSQSFQEWFALITVSSDNILHLEYFECQ